MKYIIFNNGQCVLFSRGIQHTDIADMVHKHLDAKRTVTGAGYVKFEDGIPIVYGDSIGLGIQSKQQDAEDIKLQYFKAVDLKDNSFSPKHL